jgi:hypothetical protein
MPLVTRCSLSCLYLVSSKSCLGRSIRQPREVIGREVEPIANKAKVRGMLGRKWIR